MEAWDESQARLPEGYGRTSEGFEALADAFAVIHTTGERVCEAELYRLQGELSLQAAVQRRQSTPTTAQSLSSNTQDAIRTTHAEAEAEACFLQALEVARRQQAKSLELRAAMSLARLWRQQHKRAEAHRLLADIYHWFAEGFETPELREATVLLQDLADN